MTAGTTPPGGRAAAMRLAGIGLLAAGVAVALYVAGRIHTANPASSLFGRQYLAAVTLKAVLATVALGLAALQVLLALWIYRKLPLAGSPPRPVRLVHRVVGFVLFAFTVPIAVHCLIAYGVQLTSVRVAVHSLAGCELQSLRIAQVVDEAGTTIWPPESTATSRTTWTSSDRYKPLACANDHDRPPCNSFASRGSRATTTRELAAWGGWLND